MLPEDLGSDLHSAMAEAFGMDPKTSSFLTVSAVNSNYAQTRIEPNEKGRNVFDEEHWASTYPRRVQYLEHHKSDDIAEGA